MTDAVVIAVCDVVLLLCIGMWVAAFSADDDDS
jgi:hypothetical protein